MPRRIAIIGAGVAGLAAGGDLQAAGWQVTLYEKSRGVGGRLATRREGQSRFDHGAQYVKAPAGRLRELVEACRDEQGAPGYDIGLPVWTFDAAGQISTGDPAQNADPKWCWPGGVNALAKHMAQGLTIQREVEIGAIEERRSTEMRKGAAVTERNHGSAEGAQDAEGYRLYDTAGSVVGEADCVLIAVPGPQAAAIIAASSLSPGVAEPLLAELAQIRYRRCVSISIAYPRCPAVPWYALVNTDRAHPISWLACEHAKLGHAPANEGLITLQMADGWSVAHYDELAKGSYIAGGPVVPPAIAEAQRLGEALLGANLGEPLWINVQRWRYALPDAGASFEALNNGGGGLYFAGDGVAGQGRVHLAIESGWRVAALIEGVS
jgi:renalase